MINQVSIIQEISDINKAIGAPDLTAPISEILNSKEKTVYLSVLGQFKSGKSSLINSIIGESILPVGVVPVTAIVTRLIFGYEPGLIIRYINGKESHFDISELPAYVTEKLNPENVKEVAQAIVEHPSLEPFKNISLVDTPGLGSLYRHNDEAAKQWLPFTGMAIVTISAERPLSEEDITLLKGIVQYCPETALIITKADLFGDSEMMEIKDYISGSLKKINAGGIQLFEYSVNNQQKYREALIRNLILPLNNNSSNKIKQIVRHKTQNLMEQSISYAGLALQSAAKREKEKDSVNKILEDIRNNRHHHEREMLLSGSAFKDKVRSKLEKVVLPYLSGIRESIIIQFKTDFQDWKGSLYNVSRHYEYWLNIHIGEEIKRMNDDCFNSVIQIVRETAGYYQYSALQFRQRLDDKLSEVFGVRLPSAYWQIDFTGIDRPDINIYRTFDSHIDSLLFFLPINWFRNIFYRHYINQIPFETEKNLHRYISALTGKLIKTIDAIHEQALLYISNEIRNIENILQRPDTSYRTIQYYLERLENIKKKENAD
ncbi:MAG TPA: dynamin family protein [Cyclobacteriaceae bacterium]|nr:dynamin family protein [Cyclobacteriaceae bacterium]